MPKVKIVDDDRRLDLDVPELDLAAWGRIFDVLYPNARQTYHRERATAIQQVENKVATVPASAPVSQPVMPDDQLNQATAALAEAFNHHEEETAKPIKLPTPEPPASRPQYGDKVLCSLHCEECDYKATSKVPYGDRWVRCPYCGTHLHMYPAVYGTFGEPDEDGFYYKATHVQTEAE